LRILGFFVLLTACTKIAEGPVCGSGTTEKDGACVVALQCGDGTELVNGACVAALGCGNGTEEVDGACVATGDDVSCADGTRLEGTTCIPVNVGEAASPAELVTFACVKNRCDASKVVEYWDKLAGWNDHATVRTLTFTEVSADEYDFVVTDKDGAAAELVFNAGTPVTLTLVNLAANTKTHFLTAPAFSRAVAWRKVATAKAEYHGPTFDALGLKVDATAGTSMELRFVPMVAGTYGSYCELGVTGGGSYASVLSGEVVLDLTKGHAGKGMVADLTIAGELKVDGLAVTLFHDVGLDRASTLDGDGRRDKNHAVWKVDGVDQADKTYFEVDAADGSIRFEEPDESSYDYSYDDIAMTVGKGYALRLKSIDSNERDHFLTSPGFFQDSVLRQAEDASGTVKAGYLSGIMVKPGGYADLYLVPTVARTYSAYCEIGVRTANNGAPDLATGHAGKVMTMTITVAN
jgi:hypothetical protein